jgi:hypothetical protein
MYEQTTPVTVNAFTNLNYPPDSTLAFWPQEIKKPHTYITANNREINVIMLTTKGKL